jgi:hypothetical protein
MDPNDVKEVVNIIPTQKDQTNKLPESTSDPSFDNKKLKLKKLIIYKSSLDHQNSPIHNYFKFDFNDDNKTSHSE